MKSLLLGFIVSTAMLLTPLRASDSAENTFSFLYENDYFGGSDKYYTAGNQFTWSTYTDPAGASEQRIQLLDQDWLPFYGRPNARRVNTYFFGQHMYAPPNLSISAPQPDDRPYAGWLYAGVVFSRATEDVLTSVQIALGVVGPASAAEWLQKEVHKLIDSPNPEGWGNQLSNEPGLILAYQKTWRLGAGQEGDLGWDLLPNAGATVGNIYVQASGGVMGRLGWHLPKDFGIGSIRPGTAPTLAPDLLPLEETSGWSVYGFGGAQLLAVAHNIFLDGNTFEDSPSVSKEPFVAYLQAGVALAYHHWRFAYTQKYLTEEFRAQTSGQWIGSCTLSRRF